MSIAYADSPSNSRPVFKTFTNDGFLLPTENHKTHVGPLEIYSNEISGTSVTADAVFSDDKWIAIFQNETDIPSYVRISTELAATIERVSPIGGAAMLTTKKVLSFLMFCLGVFGVGCTLTNQVMTPFGGILLAVFCFFVSYQMWKDSEEGGYRH